MENVTCCHFSGGAGEGRLSDLNPEEIDRVEVLKGPAAAALYGVEGSAGVIQVFTKRGRPHSSPTFTLNTGIGFNRLRANLPTRLRPNFTGPEGFAAWDPNEHLIENGLVNNYDMTVSGGWEDVAYFAAGGLTYQEGSVKPSDQTRANLRVNVNWTLADKLSVDVTSGFVHNRIRPVQSGNTWLGVYTNAMLSDPFKATDEEPYGGGLNEEVNVADAKAIETTSEADRWTVGVHVNYSPMPNFTARLAVGTDRISEEKTRVLPFGRYYTHLGEWGEKNLGYRESRRLNMDLLTTYEYVLDLHFLSGSVSLGARTYRDDVSTEMFTGRPYRGPMVIGDRFRDELTFEDRGRGAFVVNRLNAGDDLFVTVSVRVDEHSTLGDSLGLQVYPQAAIAYGVPRSVLPAAISNLWVRAAVGMAGKPVSPRYRNSPEPDLEPENKSEFEAGIDLGFMDDRIGIELTYYDARVWNALLPRFVTTGPAGETEYDWVEDCCEIMNRGVEASVKSWLVDTPWLRWNMNLTYEWNQNRITDLGPKAEKASMPIYEQREDGTWEYAGFRIAPRVAGWFVGESVGDIWAYGIGGYDPGTNRHTLTEQRFNRGGIYPTHLGSIANSFRIGDHLQLAFQLRGEMGAVMRNSERARGVREGAYDEYLMHLDSAGSGTPASDSVLDYHTVAVPIDKRDHVRLQEVSLSYAIPEDIAGLIGLERTTVTLSGYNLHWWDDCNCTDPSQKYHASDFASTPFMGLPQPRRFLLSVRTRF